MGFNSAFKEFKDISKYIIVKLLPEYITIAEMCSE
jgi:hypothetical protein